MENYKTRVFDVLEFISGACGSMLFLILLQSKHYIFSIPLIFFILSVIHPIFSNILVDEEGITIRTSFYHSNIYFYELIKKLEIKKRRIKLKGQFPNPDYVLLFNPEIIKEGIKKYKPELLE
ncbi:MAG: hypothetical protein KAV48_06270 [Methanomicrobia archaeon]|nr:hypothetical protein [Methanomicrobia archaeon]MCK4310389.1 hypothetical protein [Methanomicrobia archaeon]MCK4433523.1 hypothetical protein [Methanomicrobia archaeon]MCK4636558.1 hypothetical protein [Methanomicrobia archaeon]